MLVNNALHTITENNGKMQFIYLINKDNDTYKLGTAVEYKKKLNALLVNSTLFVPQPRAMERLMFI